MTATITTEVASNTANLLMDIKPGYMLGGKPRHQVWGHIIGIIAGACASTPALLPPLHERLQARRGHPVHARHREVHLHRRGSQWKGISEFIQGLTGEGGLTAIIHPSG